MEIIQLLEISGITECLLCHAVLEIFDTLEISDILEISDKLKISDIFEISDMLEIYNTPVSAGNEIKNCKKCNFFRQPIILRGYIYIL